MKSTCIAYFLVLTAIGALPPTASAQLTREEIIGQGIDPAQAEIELEALKHCDADQGSMHVCASVEHRKADNELNKLYKKQMARLSNDPKNANRLKQAQRAWLKYVEADCLYQNGSNSEGGSIWPMLNVQCWTEHTKTRAAILKTFVECTSDGCLGD